jgi:hypothetical protein
VESIFTSQELGNAGNSIGAANRFGAIAGALVFALSMGVVASPLLSRSPEGWGGVVGRRNRSADLFLGVGRALASRGAG